MTPLEGIKVLDFSQFLAGPACGLRLADLGAEVIKVERPGVGDICRQLYVAKQKMAGESTIFHAINRNKKSVALNLKSEADFAKVIELVKGADVVIQNFRPGVAQKLGIDYPSLRVHNPKLVYGSVSGYGTHASCWYKKPGQDLLAQSMSGLVWQNIDPESPSPMGLAIADLSAAYDLTQGILALLVRRGVTGVGGETSVSLLESLLSLQAQPLTERQNPSPPASTASEFSGVFPVKDGHIALQADSLKSVCRAISLPDGSSEADVSQRLKNQDRESWISCFETARIPAAPVLNWHELRRSEHYQSLQFEQSVIGPEQVELTTTRCPITIDGRRFTSSLGAPAVGEHNDQILGTKPCS